MVIRFKFRKQIIAVQVVLCLFFFQKGVAQDTVTLKIAIEKTLSNNSRLKQEKFNMLITEKSYDQSKLLRLPSISAVNNTYLNYGRSLDPSTYTYVDNKILSSTGSLVANLVLFQGFQKENQIVQNKLLAQTASSVYDKIKYDLTLAVLTTYLNILVFGEQLRIVEKQLNFSQKQFEQDQLMVEAGKKTTTDLLVSKHQVSIAILNKTKIYNQLQTYKLELSQLMERDSNVKFEVKIPPDVLLVDSNTIEASPELFKKAQLASPDVRLAGLQTEVAHKGIALAKSTLFPTVSFVAALATNYSNFPKFDVIKKEYLTAPFFNQVSANSYHYYGFNINIPILNGFYNRINVQKSKLAYQLAAQNEKTVQTNINKIIHQAVLDVNASKLEYSVSLSLYESAKQAFSKMKERYELNLINSLTFIKAQDDYNSAELGLVQSKFSVFFRKQIIDFYLGDYIY